MAGEQNKKGDMWLQDLWREFPQFKGCTMRIDRDKNMASVLDVISMVIGKAAMYEAWSQIKKSKDHSVVDILSEAEDAQINGVGKPTPIAPFRVLLEIIFLLPGKRAHEFRRTCATYIARLLSGDVSLIPEIEARYDASTPEEREFFRNGTDETPDRKRRREELEEERRLRLRREEAEVRRLEMENITMYRGLLEDFGLDRDPRMRMLLNDTLANILVPTRTSTAIEESAIGGYVTVAKFLVDRGITDRSSSTVGRMLARTWREQEGCEPEETLKMVQGDLRPVKVYPVRFLEKHVLG